MFDDKNRRRGERRFQAYLAKRWALQQIAYDLAEYDAETALYPNSQRRYFWRYKTRQRHCAHYLKNGGKRTRGISWEYEWDASGHSWRTQIDKMDMELRELKYVAPPWTIET